jgi:hypothetical protein
MKANYDFKFKNHFTLEDVEGCPGYTRLIRKTSGLDQRGKLWYPYFLMHIPVLIMGEVGRMKLAAPTAWKDRELPSVVAAREGKHWPFHTLKDGGRSLKPSVAVKARAFCS